MAQAPHPFPCRTCHTGEAERQRELDELRHATAEAKGAAEEATSERDELRHLWQTEGQAMRAEVEALTREKLRREREERLRSALTASILGSAASEKQRNDSLHFWQVWPSPSPSPSPSP